MSRPKTMVASTGKATVFYLLMIPCLSVILSCFGYVPDEEEFEKIVDLLEGRDPSQAVEALKPLLSKLKNPETMAKCRYLIATRYRESGRWKEAISYYQSTLEEEEFLFADLASFHIATGYRILHNYGSAIEWYEKILRDYPDTFSAVEARYQLGECYFTVRQYQKAVQHYAKFTEDYPEEKRVRMIKYKIGCAYQEMKKWPEAYVRYQELIRQDARDDIAQKVLVKIKSLVLSYPSITITRDDRMYYGLALYYAGRYSTARQELEKVMKELDSDDMAVESAYFIAHSYYRERKYSAAIRGYSHVAEKYPESDYALTAQYQIALCYWQTGKEKESDALLAKFAAAHPESDLADNARFQMAQHFQDKGKYKEAADAYGEMAADYATSNLADDALWNAGWCRVKLKAYDTSSQAFRRLVDEYPGSALAGSARFWAGVSCERTGKWQMAVDSYKEAVHNNDWYYSDRANRRIELLIKQGKTEENMSSIQYEKARIDDSIPAWQNVGIPVPTRAQELLDLRIFDDAEGELLMSVKTAVGLESAYYNLSLCYEKMGNFADSSRYAWRLSQLPGMRNENGAMPGHLQRMLYPVAYAEAVFTNARKNNLDPLLVLAIMREESSYNPAAISYAGAMGLTQIMPSTGRDIARSLKINPFEKEMLLQPELNIRMGTWYLGGLVKRFDDRVQGTLAETEISEPQHYDTVKILASAAYNAGETRIRRWVKRYGIEDIDEFVESIPIYQTKRYIKKVCNSYEMYKFLYGGQSKFLVLAFAYIKNPIEH